MTKKPTVYLFGIIATILITGFLFVVSQDTSVGNVSLGNTNGDVQNIVIGMKDYNYYPNTITVKAGMPVSIRLDESVYGCYRDFTIRDFGIRKYLKTPQDTVVFTPTEPGKYVFACSMGMGTGMLIVE